mmetsp:Transcript_84409/g.257745  ORF Transcript_84409/g.257745 Transcript_84409/m.257745 type:complete len:421 (-) Transcript_84409:60-1322(-)
MRDERAAVSQIRHEGDHLHAVHERFARLVPALEAEGEERPGALRAVLLVQGEVAAAEPGVPHPLHLRVLLQEPRHLQRVVAMLLHPQGQRLHAHRDQEGVERADAHPHVPQPKSPGGDRERHAALPLRPHALRHGPVLPKRLVQLHTVVRFARLRQHWELPRPSPIEVTLLHDEAPHRVAMTPQALRGAVDDDIGTVLEGSDQVRCGCRVVHNQWQTVLVRDACELLQVQDKATRVRDRLAIHCLCPGRDGALDAIEILVAAKRNLPTELLELTPKLREGAAVQLVRGHDVVAWLHQVAEGQQLRRVAARGRHRGAAALQRCDLLLDRVRRGVRDPRVNGSELAEGEPGRRLLGVLENKSSAHVDGRRAGAGGGVWLLPRVQALRAEARVRWAAAPQLLARHGQAERSSTATRRRYKMEL